MYTSNEGYSITTINVKKDLYRKFKIILGIKGVTVKTEFNKYMEDYIEENKNLVEDLF